MLIKVKDDIEPGLRELRDLLTLPNLSTRQRSDIETEIFRMNSGQRGEADAAYQIDFHLKDSRNYAIAHDLRLEHNGRVAQIDHLLIGRFFDIILIESKNISTGLRVNAEGIFEVRTRFGWRGMASPVEQSKRHAIVLDDLLRERNLLPTRLGFRITPTYHHWVLVPPECHVSSKDRSARIVRRDLFAKELKRWGDRDMSSNPLTITKLVASETIGSFLTTLAEHHRPFTMDYARRFGVTPPAPEPVAPAPPPPPVCEGCAAPLEAKVVEYCQGNADRFGGRLLCRPCQKKATRPAPSAPCCDECGCEVDAKVVAFCRFNSKRFGKRLLCRECQPKASAPPRASEASPG